ncbi:MAG: hydrogenase maturation protease [Planctomycetaceae bacterium]|nr:hydrogenase maturation protease [Planctomycetaceae bacterium]
MSARPRLVLGLGSPHGDDQAGWLVVDALHRLQAPPDVARKLADPTEVWVWASPGVDLIVCDASQGTGPAGTVRAWSWPQDVFPVPGQRSTHRYPLVDVLELGRALGLCPERVLLWTIEGRAFAPDTSPDQTIVAAAEMVARQLAEMLVNA